MSIKYTYHCTNCDKIFYEYRKMRHRDELGVCPECEHPSKRIIDPPTVLIDGSLSGACPGAEMKWLADRERRRAKEIENVKNHGEGQEYPNLLDV